MPKRSDIKKILIIGAGPIIIGQACEFDYSGTQACKALREEGYQVVLLNSNPATIMTDPDFADKTYIEPVTAEYVTKVIEKERPDALLPTMGGQTSLNVAVELAKSGTLDRLGVQLIGADLNAIELAEDREQFKLLMERLNLKTPRAAIATTIKEGEKIAQKIGFPIILRPAYTLGGAGGGIAYNIEEFDEILLKGLTASPVRQVLVEQSVIGWKEFEMEVMRDCNDNVVIICSIENFDPMGVHTGDSITVAPVQTMTDREYQKMRDASIKIIRGVGIETGGCNVQFAQNPLDGELVVIEMNPRVSRSSALASKATGFPIAKIAAKLSVGYTLDEIPNDITKQTMASFEPALDYVVTKIPRFAFEKFPLAKTELGTQMKSVGETMAIARSFKESFQKAMRSLEYAYCGFHSNIIDSDIAVAILFKAGVRPDLLGLDLSSIETSRTLEQALAKEQELVKQELAKANPKRIIKIFDALYLGISAKKISRITGIDLWFIIHLHQIVAETISLQKSVLNNFSELSELGEDALIKVLAKALDKELLLKLKKYGFADLQIARILRSALSLNPAAVNTRVLEIIQEGFVRKYRQSLGLNSVYKTIDTCAAEFESYTPYHYSSYDSQDEIQDTAKDKVLILGGGPNRIGQGIEFDYCCVHAAMALKEAGYEAIMVNNNPETVSTDFDTSSKLYFEPITEEDVLAIWNREKSFDPSRLKGVIVQLGGQTPLNICRQLEANGVKILGTSPSNIDLAEDRKQFGDLLNRLKLKQTPNASVASVDEARLLAEKIGYPLVMRPSYVLGGRGMEIVYNTAELEEWVARTIIEEGQFPILLDKFLDNAIELDVDAVSDGTETIIAGIMEHIEYAGIHSGDSASVYPSQSLSQAMLDEVTAATKSLAKALEVRGLMNIQFAVANGILYVLEVNPRASRTVPFICKATGVPWAKIASLVMLGKSLKEQGVKEVKIPKHISVKEAVFSFSKFEGADIFLGPEMKSTGEVMGISYDFAVSFGKSQIAASSFLPKEGKVFVSFNDKDKQSAVQIVKELFDLGFVLVATSGTATFLSQELGAELIEYRAASEGLVVAEFKNTIQVINKVKEGRPNIIDGLKNEDIHLILNIPYGKEADEDSRQIGHTALLHKIPVVTTISAAKATVAAIAALQKNQITVTALQDFN